MKKFDDVLRILSSILLGVLIKDFYVMTVKLNEFFAAYHKISHEDKLSFCTVIVLIAVFFRNIHGSARYDDFRKKTCCVLGFEQSPSPFGRFGIFCLSVAALFFGPSYAGQILSHYLNINTSANWLIFSLFLPFLIYGFYDLVLLLSISESAQNGEQDGLSLDDVVLKWNKLNVIGILIYLIFQGYALILERVGEKISAMDICLAFIIIAITIVGGDYVLNRAFYFPPYNQENEQID